MEKFHFDKSINVRSTKVHNEATSVSRDNTLGQETLVELTTPQTIVEVILSTFTFILVEIEG